MYVEEENAYMMAKLMFPKDRILREFYYQAQRQNSTKSDFLEKSNEAKLAKMHTRSCTS